ncbi:MAG: hypothetical protein NC341_02575 [Blautia sp.]|nr:hypothetical protein [Blautia sp.]MCM1200502.1 hypothetical protein [Bacteroides fragilis]
MKIRIIQLINNFYKDENGVDEDREKALGSYCTFGYFDALQVYDGSSFDKAEDNLIWKKIDEAAVRTLDGTCSRRNLICIAEEEEKDRKFWECAQNYPYLFISLIRMKRHAEGTKDVMRQMMDVMRKNDTEIAYYSYNHSELVIAKLEDSYAAGMNFVLSLRQKLNALNMYSIFSVREAVLKDKAKLPGEVKEETVSVRLRIMIKNDGKTDSFLQELWEILFRDEIREKKIPGKENFEKFYTLGSSDMIIGIEQVEMYKLLSCYGMGNLLTHTNGQFGEAVYNIETEILIKGAHIEHGKSMDNGEDDRTETTA